jgi:GNAT superfamily N-acetyltransferase
VGNRYTAHEETTAQFGVCGEILFDYLDDPARIGAHMSRRNWQTAGMRMDYVLDERRGRGVGARIGLRGALLGLRLEADEVVLEHAPPYRKTWETVGVPRLIVIRAYRMGFRIEHRDPRPRS